MRKLTSLLLTLCMVLALTACGSKKITFEEGSIDGNTYTNTSIGIKMTAPEGFEIVDAEMMALMEEDTQNLAEQNGSIVATAMSYEAVMMALDGTAMVQVAIEDMTKSIEITNSTKSFVKSLETQMEAQYIAMGFTVSETESLGTVEIGGKEFEGLKVVAEMNGVNIIQKYYAYRAGDVMFEIITTSTGDSEEALEQFISSIEAVE